MTTTTSTASSSSLGHSNANEKAEDVEEIPDMFENGPPGKSTSSQAEANLSQISRAGPGLDIEKTEGDLAPPPLAFDPSQFPDGGWEAWLVVLGAFCCLFCSFGWINCIGIFQEYYERTLLREYSSSDVSWITSLETFMMFAGGPIIGKLFDNYGPRYILLAGSCLHVFGLMMSSLATQYYQFILAQGICSPLGASMIFYPAMSCLPTWFWKYRALAFGSAAAGSSVGGVVIPIMVNRLIPRVGFPWAMRSAAFLLLFMLIIGNLTVRSRLPPQPKPVKFMEFITPLTEVPFLFTLIGSLLFFFGMFLPINYLTLQAQRQGMSIDLSVYLIAILNALSFFGRTIPGYVGDKVGRFNVMIVMASFTAIIDFAIWIPAKSNALLIAFAALYGFGSGTFVSMAPSLIAQISDVRKIGVRTGTVFAIISIAALTGSPIGGAILTDWDGDFLGMQIFAGVMQIAGAAFFLAARVSLEGWKLMVKV